MPSEEEKKSVMLWGRNHRRAQEAAKEDQDSIERTVNLLLEASLDRRESGKLEKRSEYSEVG